MIHIYAEFSHWVALLPVAVVIVARWRGRTVAPEERLFASAFLVSWLADLAVDLIVTPGSNGWWIAWMFAPFELVLLTFVVNRSPRGIVLFLVALMITDGALLQTGNASLSAASPVLSTIGWMTVAVYADRFGNRPMLLRKAVILYASGVALFTATSLARSPDYSYLLWIGYFAFQTAKMVALVLFLVAVGFLKLPLNGLSLLSLSQRLRLDRGVRGHTHSQTTVHEIERALQPHAELCPPELRDLILEAVRQPERILTVGEMSARLNMDSRSIQRAYKRAGLPQPSRLNKLIRLAHAHAMLRDDPDVTFEAVAKRLRVEVRTLRRYSTTELGVPFSEFATRVRASQILAAMIYAKDRSAGKRVKAP